MDPTICPTTYYYYYYYYSYPHTIIVCSYLHAISDVLHTTIDMLILTQLSFESDSKMDRKFSAFTWNISYSCFLHIPNMIVYCIYNRYIILFKRELMESSVHVNFFVTDLLKVVFHENLIDRFPKWNNHRVLRVNVYLLLPDAGLLFDVSHDFFSQLVSSQFINRPMPGMACGEQSII